MASESDTDCRPRMRFLVGGYGKGDAARNTLDGDDKAQNDLLLVSNVGLGVAPISARYLLVFLSRTQRDLGWLAHSEELKYECGGSCSLFFVEGCCCPFSIASLAP